MDELAAFNRSRWNALAKARIQYSRPKLELDEKGAWDYLNTHLGISHEPMPQIAGKDVFCLASGGGQQTAVFGILGANVTVLDLSDTQLERGREAANHHGYALTAVHGDMRDLSQFADNSFDIVFHAFSINFVPDAAMVIKQVGRIVRPGGWYRLTFANPFWTMEETDWTEAGYPIKQTYITGQKLQYTDAEWTFEDDDGNPQKVEGPHEFMHTYSAVLNGLIAANFRINGFREWPEGDAGADPGTWEHLLSVVPPFVSVTAVSQK